MIYRSGRQGASFLRRYLLVSATSLAAFYPAAAFAQSATAGSPATASDSGSTAKPAAEGGALGDIIVTARRKSENLERVPISVAALSSNDLKERGVTTQADLQTVTPGLVVRPTATRNQFTYSIRGQTIEAFSGSKPGVLAYVDDFQLTAVSQGGFYDLESVQVLKGPQGTLFGRNTIGGAILFATAKPNDTLGGYLTGRLGNYAQREVEGAVNIPILEDKIMLRAAGLVRSHSGYVSNLLTGGKLNDDNFKSGRLSLTIKPNDTIESTTVAQYDHSSNHGSALILYSVYPCGPGSPPAGIYLSCAFGPANPGFDQIRGLHPEMPPGGISESLDIQKKLGPWKLYADAPTVSKATTRFITNTTKVSFGDDITFKNIIGYAHSYNFDMYDQDGSTARLYSSIGLATDLKQFSEEPQLLGKSLDGKLDWIIGAYFSRDSELHQDAFDAFDLRPISDPIYVNYNFRSIEKTQSIFAQATYDLESVLPGLKVTGGFRYTWSQVSLTAIDNPSVPVGQSVTLKRKDKKPSWTFGFDYQATPQLLLYVTTRGSWRSGGYNGHVPPTPLATFKPETTKDVEIGSKFQGRIANMPTRLNLAAYYQWVNNTQRNLNVLLGGSPSAFTLNAPGGSKVKGLEAELVIDPARWLQLGASYALTYAKFGQPNSLTLFGQSTALGPYADAPHDTVNFYARISKRLDGSMGELSLRGEVFFQDHTYFSNTDNVDPGTRIPHYSLVNLRGDWTGIAGTGLSLGLYAKNLFNKGYYTGGLSIGGQSGINSAIPGDPRTFGAELSVKF